MTSDAPEASQSANRVVMWDFDATLAERPGIWSQAVLDVLDQQEPGHSFDRDDMRPHVSGGFPWNFADEPHGFVDDPEGWWTHLNQLFITTYTNLGYTPDRAATLALGVRPNFLRPSAWRLFDDTLSALERAVDAGWRNIVVSNHVPELIDLVEHLEIDAHLDIVVTSALVGFDKPNPGIFQHSLELAGRPDEVWMVGDNPIADVVGAATVGVPAIQVRTADVGPNKVDGLHEALDIILGP